MPDETEEIIRKGVRRAIIQNELTGWQLDEQVVSALYREPNSDKVTVRLVSFDDKQRLEVTLDLAAIVDRFKGITIAGVADEFARVYHQKP